MLLNLINDLLDYAKFENGKFSFYNEIFDLGNLIKDNTFQTISYCALEK
jgi:signal transduction histidine kinase